jgi:hypothetical protein
MTALRTSTRGVLRIDGSNRHPNQACLVFDKSAELKESPTAVSGSLPLAKPFLRPFADASEVFQSDTGQSAFSLSNKPITDDVVHIAAETRFFAACALDGLMDAAAAFATPPRFLLCVAQPGAVSCLRAPHLLNAFRPVNVPATGSGNVLHPKINTNEVADFPERFIRNVYRDEQEPLAIIAENKVALSLGETEALGLILAHQVGDDNAPCQRGNTDAINTAKTDVLAPAKRDSGVFAEAWPLALVSLVGFDHLSDTADSGVGREFEAFAEFGISDFLQGEFVAESSLEGDPGEPIRAGVEGFDGLAQAFGLLWVRQQLELQRQFHTSILSVKSTNINLGRERRRGHSPVA